MLEAIISPSRVFMDLEPMPKEPLLREISRCLQRLGEVADADMLAGRLIDRERMASTGVHPGFAFPHVFSPQVNDLTLTIGVIKDGTDYQSNDGSPVKFILMLLGPTEQQEFHLRLLARLSKIARQAGMFEALLEAISPEAVVATFAQADRLLAAHT